MKLPSFSIATMMCIVAAAAVDGYLLRQIDYGGDNEEILGAAGIFCMVNILAIPFLRVVSRPARIGPSSSVSRSAALWQGSPNWAVSACGPKRWKRSLSP
jgi:hypothetical protein